MILTALMCARIPPSPDNFKRVIRYQTSQAPFQGDIAFGSDEHKTTKQEKDKTQPIQANTATAGSRI